MPDFPIKWASRGQHSQPLIGKLPDGTILPEGTYKFLVSALRDYGDETKQEGWDIVELVPFNIKTSRMVE